MHKDYPSAAQYLYPGFQQGEAQRDAAVDSAAHIHQVTTVIPETSRKPALSQIFLHYGCGCNPSRPLFQ